jgi:hypothetical protein
LLRQLVTESRLVIEPALYQRPLFWVAVGVVAAAAAGTTFALTRPTKTVTTAEIAF